MTNLKELYTELIALTQLYLFQNLLEEERLLVESPEYYFFRDWAIKQKQQSLPAVPATLTPAKDINISSTLSIAPQMHAEKSNLPVKNEIIGEPSVASYSTPAPKLPLSSIQKSESSIQKLQSSASISTQKTDASPLLTPNLESDQKNDSFILEVGVKPKLVDFNELRKTVQDCFPHLLLLDQIPDDREARTKSTKVERNKQAAQLLILSFDESSKQHAFLSKVGMALEIYGISNTVINATKFEQANEWVNLLSSSDLRLLIACSYQIQALPNLMKHYREEIKQAKYYFGKIPALLLPDVTMYFKEPMLKLSLWKAIKFFFPSLGGVQQ
jgi:hypothetical protein